jgi:hypothetical protein
MDALSKLYTGCWSIRRATGRGARRLRLKILIGLDFISIPLMNCVEIPKTGTNMPACHRLSTALIHFGIAPYLNWTMVRAGSLAYILKDNAGQALPKHRPAAFPMFTCPARRYTA